MTRTKPGRPVYLTRLPLPRSRCPVWGNSTPADRAAERRCGGDCRSQFCEVRGGSGLTRVSASALVVVLPRRRLRRALLSVRRYRCRWG